MTIVARRVPFLCSAAAFLLAACGSDGGGSSAGDGPVELDIRVQAADPVPDDDPIRNELNEALNVEISMTTTGAGDYFTQLSADIAAGDFPDLFQVDRARLQQLADQGLLLDISDYLDDELAIYTEETGDDLLTLGNVGGTDYGLVSGTGWNYNSYWIRKDWLDNLGLDVPTTVDDFAEVARAFTEDDPDGNGHDDTYGLGGADDGGLWSPLWAAFGSGGVGASYGERGGSFYMDGSEIVNGFYDPDTVDALEYISGLVESGVVDPDFMTLDGAQAHERAMQGTVGIINIGWPHMTKPDFVEQYKSVQPEAEWIQMMPMSGPGGDGAYPKDGYSARMYAIPRTLEEEPEKLEKLFELINYVSEGDGRRLVTFGIEGQHYNLEGDTIVPTEAMETEAGHIWIYQFTGRDEGEYLSVKFADTFEYVEFAEDQPTLETFDSLVLAPEGFNMADAGRFAQESMIAFVTGQRPLDEYDDFLETLSTQFKHQKFVDSGIEQLQELGVG